MFRFTSNNNGKMGIKEKQNLFFLSMWDWHYNLIILNSFETNGVSTFQRSFYFSF